MRRHSRLDALPCAHPSVGHADDPGVAAAHQEDEAEQRHVPSARHKTGVYERWRWEKALGEAHQNGRRHQNAPAPAEASAYLNTLRIPLTGRRVIKTEILEVQCRIEIGKVKVMQNLNELRLKN